MEFAVPGVRLFNVQVSHGHVYGEITKDPAKGGTGSSFS